MSNPELMQKKNTIQLTYFDGEVKNGYSFIYDNEGEMLRKISNFLKVSGMIKETQELNLIDKKGE